MPRLKEKSRSFLVSSHGPATLGYDKTLKVGLKKVRNLFKQLTDGELARLEIREE